MPTAVAAAPLTTLLVSFGEWVRHLTSWLSPMDIAQVLAVSPLALPGLFLLTAGLPAALLPSRTRPPRHRAIFVAAPLIAALLAAGLVAATLQTPPAFFISPPQMCVSK